MSGWLFLVTLAAVRALPLAPLPPPFESEARHGAYEDYRPVPDLKGYYAHGFAGVPWESETPGPPCIGTEAEQKLLLASLPKEGKSEFWFYTTGVQAILLTRTARLDTGKSCAVALSYHYDAERAYVANGFIHSLSVDDLDGMSAIGSWPTTRGAGEYAADFERIQSLMATNPQILRGREKEIVRIAGIRAVCGHRGGLIWSTICLAADGPAKGMLLRAISGDDERTTFTTEVKELRTNLMLPGVLFEIDRTWRGKEQ